MTARSALCILLFTLASQATKGQARYFDYIPGAGFQLGLGFDIEAPTTPREPFLKVDTTTIVRQILVHDSTNVEATWSQKLIYNERSLNEALNISANLSARYLSANLSASYGIDKSRLLSSRTVTLVLIAKGEYAQRSLGRKVYLPDAEALRNKGDMNTFVKLYGNRFVHAVRMGVRINTMITISFNSEADAQATRASLGLSASGFAWNARAQASFDKIVKTASSEGRVNIEVHSIGGPDAISKLAPLLTSATGWDGAYAAITKIIGSYVEKFNYRNSVPIGFFYENTATQIFPEGQDDDLENDAVIDRLDKLGYTYRRTKEKRIELESAMDQGYFRAIASPVVVKATKQLVVAYSDYMEWVAARYDSCRSMNIAQMRQCKCCGVPEPAFSDTLYDRFTKDPFLPCEFMLNAVETFRNGDVHRSTCMRPDLAGQWVLATLHLAVWSENSYNPPDPAPHFAYKMYFGCNTEQNVLEGSADGWKEVDSTIRIQVPTDGKIEVSLIIDSFWGHANNQLAHLGKESRIDLTVLGN